MLSGRPAFPSPRRKSRLKFLCRKQRALGPIAGTLRPERQRKKNAMKFRRRAFPEVRQRPAQDRS